MKAVLIGIFTLQITIIAGGSAIINEMTPAVEGSWVVLLWLSLLLTLGVLVLDHYSS